MQRVVQSSRLLAAVSHASRGNRPKNKAIVIVVDHALSLWYLTRSVLIAVNRIQLWPVVWKQNIL